MNHQSPLFSILVANYNNGRYFKDCFESIISQTYQNWEVIIVDDCSTDNSVEMIRKLIEHDERFKIYVNEENKGCGFSKRKCAELAGGEICGFLDPDDTITSNALELMVNAHAQYPEAALIHSKCYICDDNLNILKEYTNGKNVKRRDDFLNLDGEIFVFAAYKNSFYKKTSGIDSYFQRAVDQDLYLKLYEAGETVYLDEFLYLYRIHNGGISTNTNMRKAEYWRWVVNMKAAERRNINIETVFTDNFAQMRELEHFKQKYYSLRKFEAVQNFYLRIKKIFK
ncbi:glycosyltransferase involved in cell wall biosynthesis [Chryseobacterium defluvii]|uniref:Glycosyltransferase involved in cell wall biosynthesis n=1 Tax=Chryseobacterium defluvii TaxID=160396 RepID=A0A840KGE4_9FLAO|nr:glycosyltransferase [Chryseobacterium defluvii]MBB4806603.1 glycosyltransferase involved in cell wall biosynthesis [Chryseobacterium defluvii]